MISSFASLVGNLFLRLSLLLCPTPPSDTWALTIHFQLTYPSNIHTLHNSFCFEVSPEEITLQSTFQSPLPAVGAAIWSGRCWWVQGASSDPWPCLQQDRLPRGILKAARCGKGFFHAGVMWEAANLLHWAAVGLRAVENTNVRVSKRSGWFEAPCAHLKQWPPACWLLGKWQLKWSEIGVCLSFLLSFAFF